MIDATAVTRFLENPEGLIQRIEATGNFDDLFDYIQVIVDAAHTLDSRLDFVLSKGEELYERLSPKEYRGMTFREAVLFRTDLRNPKTIERHLRVGKMVEVAPEEVRPTIERMRFQSKIQIANTLEKGVELTEDQWTELADAYYPQDVAEKLHEINNTTPRSQWCSFIEDEDGNLWAKTKIGTFMYREAKQYENPEVQETMDWVHKKAKTRLGVTPK